MVRLALMADPTFVKKLMRAGEHASAFNEAVEWWLEGKPYRLSVETDTETDTKEFVVIAERQPSDRLSLMFGDAIQNLRSALDYLVGDLARANAGGHLMPRVESDLQFPITTSRTKFKSAIRSQALLGCVAARPAAFIQRAQPYRYGQDPATHPLGALQQLSNIDKHRRITLLSSVVHGLMGESIRIGSVENLQYGRLGPFVDRAVIASYSPADADVDVQLGQITVGIAFGDGLPGAGSDPRQTLRRILDLIETEIMNPLTAYL